MMNEYIKTYQGIQFTEENRKHIIQLLNTDPNYLDNKNVCFSVIARQLAKNILINNWLIFLDGKLFDVLEEDPQISGYVFKNQDTE